MRSRSDHGTARAATRGIVTLQPTWYGETDPWTSPFPLHSALTSSLSERRTEATLQKRGREGEKTHKSFLLALERIRHASRRRRKMDHAQVSDRVIFRYTRMHSSARECTILCLTLFHRVLLKPHSGMAHTGKQPKPITLASSDVDK